MEDAVTQLRELGFTKYEAQAYVALLQQSPVNGYELAKISGVPRANIYGVLEKLEARGAVVRYETSDGTRYEPMPAKDLLSRLGRRFQETLDEVQGALETIESTDDAHQVWTARGYPVLMDQARVLLSEAQEELLIAMWQREASTLAEYVARAGDRGVKVTTLCLAACPEACAGCRGHVYRYPVAPEDSSRWLIVVIDDTDLLAGEIDPTEDAFAIRTRQPLFVNLAAWYARHSIALGAVLSDLDDGLESMLNPETRSVLAAVGPSGHDGGWLKHMRHLLSQRETEQAV